MPNAENYTIKNAAQKTGISPGAIRVAIKRGQLFATGRPAMIAAADLEVFAAKPRPKRGRPPVTRAE